MSKTKLFKLIGKFLCAVVSVFVGYVAWNFIYSASSVTCLESRPEDTFNFGDTLAINNNYIAVGDPQANHVAIYSYDKSKDKWSRTKEIYPPNNSIIERINSGFGTSLIFNQNQLIIGAYSNSVPSNFDEDIQRKYRDRGFVYSLQLGRENENALKLIDLPKDINPIGYAVNVFDNQLALQTTVRKDDTEKPDNVLIVNPATLKVESIIKPPIVRGERVNFGYGIAGNSQSLAISAPNLPTNGGVYLVNKQGEIKTISISKIIPADDTRKFGSPIALSDDFFAIYSGGWSGLLSIFKQSSKGWEEIYSINFLGSLSADKSQLLISAGRYPFDRGVIHRPRNYLLIKIRDNKAFVTSTIRWKWGLHGDDAKAQGAINSKFLLLSRRGKVVLLKKNFLPSNYVINQFFCKEK